MECLGVLRENKGTFICMKNKSKEKKKNETDEESMKVLRDLTKIFTHEVKQIGVEETYSVPKSTVSMIKFIAGACLTMCTVILGIGGWMASQLYDMNRHVLRDDSQIIITMQNDIKDITEKLDGDGGVFARLAVIETKVTSLEKRMDSLEDRMDSLEDRMDSLEDRMDEFERFKDSIVGVPSLSLGEVNNTFTDNVSVEANDVSPVGAGQFDADTYIGTDVDGVDHVAGDLVGETILISYTDKGKEVYFLGQYNENYHWDGYCLTNAYNADGTLYGICESNFDDGKRLDYKSIVRKTLGTDEWIYSDKLCEDDQIIGTNIKYEIVQNGIKDFSRETVSAMDLLGTDQFMRNNHCAIRKLYSGQTVNGLYDDQTGNAYLINYDRDGKIDSLYVGCFKDGKFEDDDALEIVYDTSNGVNKYFYYRGSFVDGKRSGTVSADNYVTIEEITELLSAYSFTCKLNWK